MLYIIYFENIGYAIVRACWGASWMKARVKPSGNDGCGESFKRDEHPELSDEAAEDEYHEGRNWAVIIILSVIILSWAVGLILLIWSLVG